MRETEKGCGDKNVFMPPTCIRALSHEILLRKCRKISSYTLYELMYIPLAWSLSFKARASEFEYIVKKPRSLTLLYTSRDGGEKRGIPGLPKYCITAPFSQICAKCLYFKKYVEK